MEVLYELISSCSASKAVLVTPVSFEGSVPTPHNSRMLIWGENESLGTVGGGAVELRVQKRAVQMLSESSPSRVLLQYVLDTHHGIESVCGGTVTLLLETIEDISASSALFSRALSTLKDGFSVTEHMELPLEVDVTVTSSFSRLIVLNTSNGPELLGTLGVDDDMDKKAVQEDIHRRTVWENNGHRFLGLPVLPAAVCVVVGAGHVGRAVAQMAVLAGFRVVVCDTREGITVEGVSQMEIVSGSWSDAARVGCKYGREGMYGVVCTPGHRGDVDVIDVLLKESSAAYIGVLGSRKKKGVIFRALEKRGHKSEDIEKRLVLPVGIPIGGDTPGEIALGIVAQIVQFRNMGKITRIDA